MYDRVNKFGGAERVLLALHKIFPSAPLYTSVYHPKKARWARVFTIYPSFLQHVPFAKSYHQVFAPLMPLAFNSFSFTTYDIVISVTSESAKGIRVTGETIHICLCLSPTRYLWSGYKEYFVSPFSRFLSAPLVGLLRFWDKKIAQRPHGFIAISQEVQTRIKKYYKRESDVIYPPAMLKSKIQRLGGKRKVKDQKLETTGYFLVVSRLSRLTPYKKVEIAIKAATKLGIPLVIIGQGNSNFLKKYAGPLVKFVQDVSDAELIDYYKNAQALIFPGREDFGLVMVEALSYGTPVIAYKSGGAVEIIEEGKTGAFFKKQTVSSLSLVLKRFNKSTYNSDTCKQSAKRFSFPSFEKRIKQYILKVID